MKKIYVLENKKILLSFQREGFFKYDFFDELFSLGSSFIIITHDELMPLYGQYFVHEGRKRGKKVFSLPFPSGEENKTRGMKNKIEDQILSLPIGKDTKIVALGGGVVSDIAGFIASTLFRKMDLIIVPTTLLSMVDSAIGGKNGVNISSYKNIIGTITQPIAVFIDPNFLLTLPRKELINGWMEVVKLSIVFQKELFLLFENNPFAFLDDHNFLDEMIVIFIRLKMQIVKQDVNDKGIRKILNFGHTLAHAFESIFSFSISHGEAVFLGMLIEAYISYKLNLLDRIELKRIIDFLNNFSFYYKFRPIDKNKVVDACYFDKKRKEDENFHFVLLNGIGSVYYHNDSYTHSVEKEVIEEAIDWYNSKTSEKQLC